MRTPSFLSVRKADSFLRLGMSKKLGGFGKRRRGYKKFAISLFFALALIILVSIPYYIEVEILL